MPIHKVYQTKRGDYFVLYTSGRKKLYGSRFAPPKVLDFIRKHGLDSQTVEDDGDEIERRAIANKIELVGKQIVEKAKAQKLPQPDPDPQPVIQTTPRELTVNVRVDTTATKKQRACNYDVVTAHLEGRLEDDLASMSWQRLRGLQRAYRWWFRRGREYSLDDIRKRLTECAESYRRRRLATGLFA